MSDTEKLCAFCDPNETAWRTIHAGKLFISFVSNPRFREGQCLVVPRRHIVSVGELTPEEGAALMAELGRLSLLLDRGFGTGIMQKYQPQQAENGIKVSHLHCHVFPRFEHESGLFPVPEPNNFDGFETAPREEIAALARSLA